MSEKKKRIRPTWAQVRQLEAEIAELKDTMKFCDAFKGKESAEVINELRKKLEEQIDGTSELVKDCDLWRKKYQELFAVKNEIEEKEHKLYEDYKRLEVEYNSLNERYDNIASECAMMSLEHNELRSQLGHKEKMASDAEKARQDEYELRLQYQNERDTLKQSNDLMETELKNTKESCKDLEKANNILNKQIISLQSRTFWQRVFNK